MPRLPSARDVSNVNPRIASDPGVRVPQGSFDSPLGTAAQEIAPAVNVLSEVARKQENRRDVVHSSGLINDRAKEYASELSRLNTEEDLSDENVLGNLGSFISKRNQETLQEHQKQGASPESLARLKLRLQDIESDVVGKASALSAKIGREKVNTRYKDSLSLLIQNASTDTSLENINKQFLNLDTHLSDIRGALDPTDEDSFRKAGREQIARGAIDSLIARGRIDTADSLLRDGGLVNELAPDVQREVNRKIETVRFAKEEATREIARIEGVLGRKLKESELLTYFKLTKEEKPQAVPADFRLVKDPSSPTGERLVPVPGGKADIERQEQLQKRNERQAQSIAQSKTVIRSVDRALAAMESSGFPETLPGSSLARGALKFIGGPVFDTEQELDTIRSNIAIDAVQDIRAASPNGAGLGGNTSDRDMAALERIKGTLSIRKDPAIQREDLKNIREIYLNAWFGSPEEIQNAVQDGRMTSDQALKIQKERETVGFDAIGRALGKTNEKTEKKTITERGKDRRKEAKPPSLDIPGMSRRELLSLTDEQIDALDPKQQKILDKRLKDLGL